jgi:hypothetical protein
MLRWSSGSDERVLVDTATGYMAALRGQKADVDPFHVLHLRTHGDGRIHEVRSFQVKGHRIALADHLPIRHGWFTGQDDTPMSSHGIPSMDLDTSRASHQECRGALAALVERWLRAEGASDSSARSRHAAQIGQDLARRVDG